MCGEGVGDLLSHLQSSCWQYMGFIILTMAALGWHPSLRVPHIDASTMGEYLVHTPAGVAGLWDLMHPGLTLPARGHAEYGDAAVAGTFVHATLEVLARLVMTLPHLLERASTVDAVLQLRDRAPPCSPRWTPFERLSVRQSAILGVVVRVVPWWQLARGPELALPVPPPAGRQAGSERASMIYVCFAASVAECLWHASQSTGPPVWIVAPDQASTLRAHWPEDLCVYQLTHDATVLWHLVARVEHWRLPAKE